MIKTLETLGTRILGVFVPQLSADAGVCACDPGYTWCQYYSLRTACRCNSDCKTTTCWCDPCGACPCW